ncbi:MAG: DNA methylase [Clostridium sp.]
METKNKTYIAIDLKSFYASVECIERGLNPMTTNLVVADSSRTEKTICLAVSPSLKSFGVPGRPRLFEVVQKIREANIHRRFSTPRVKITGTSHNINELNSNRALSIDYIVAPPQMALYVEYSTKIYNVYLKYFAPEDIHIYSIDEVFIDITAYLRTYKMSPHDLVMTIIRDILKTTGITATGGIGSNLYLAKIAMDIVAKKMPPDKDGVRVAELNERSYREILWSHKPLTSFWRVGKGYAKKLEANGMYTMGDIARMSLSPYGEKLLYKLFGINAELLIDHAWGVEPCTLSEVKAYKPATTSISSGQVLLSPYSFEKARLVLKEMTDSLVLDLIDKKMVTDQIVLTIGYDIENLKIQEISREYKGEITIDAYGRKVPKSAHGTANIYKQTSSIMLIMNTVLELYDRIVNKNLLVRKISIGANKLVDEESVKNKNVIEQIDLFTDYSALEQQKKEQEEREAKEKKRQEAILLIKKKYGKNALLKGMNFEEGATGKSRNNQIGGHKA